MLQMRTKNSKQLFMERVDSLVSLVKINFMFTLLKPVSFRIYDCVEIQYNTDFYII
jgi:hypothetical protein